MASLSIRTHPVASIVLTSILLSSLAGTANAGDFYRLTATLSLPSERPNWDYLALDEAHGHLFIAQRQDGATVVDIQQQKRVSTIENSSGANAIALAAPQNRGFVINGDGSATVFDLSSLATINRVSFGKDADAAAYEPVTAQIVVMMGDSQAIAFLDAANGRVNSVLKVAADKLEAPTPDGQGHFFVTQRHRNSVARFDARSRQQIAEWPTTGCDQPTGLNIDSQHQRLFVGCRGHGEHPVLLVMNSQSGQVISTMPIGRGNDGVVYDAQAGRVITSNGVDGNLVIYQQTDPDHYTLQEATTTRPYARTMAMDHRDGTLYLVTAQGTVDPSKPVNTGPAPFYPNHYFPGTFTVLTYSDQTEP